MQTSIVFFQIERKRGQFLYFNEFERLLKRSIYLPFNNMFKIY